MSTTPTDITGSSIAAEKTVYRRYVKFKNITEGDTTRIAIDEQRIIGEGAQKDKKTGLFSAWQRAEDEGLTLFCENEVIMYNVRTLDGFTALVPDPEQQLYIINLGLSTVQSQKVQSFMKATTETGGDMVPDFNQVTLDLRTGVGESEEYSIQKAPQRRALSELDRALASLRKLGLPEDKVQEMLEVILSSSKG